MRPTLVITALLALLALPAGAQEPDPPDPDPGPSLSLDLGTPALGRLGAWTAVGNRWTVGLEIESDFRSWTRVPDGDPARAFSGTDWRFAAGPAARFRLARTGDVSLFAYGSLTWGQHRFSSLSLEPPPGGVSTSSELGVRQGVGLGWAVSERWSVAGLYTVQWLSGSDGAPSLPAHWRDPGLGLSFGFRF